MSAKARVKGRQTAAKASAKPATASESRDMRAKAIAKPADSSKLPSGAKEAALDSIKKEYYLTRGGGKYIILAIFVNLPIFGIIPYLTQAVTIILLSFFLKHLHIKEERKKEALDDGMVSYCLGKPGYWLLILATVWQAYTAFDFTMRYYGQLISLVLLGIIYATMTKYRKGVRD